MFDESSVVDLPSLFMNLATSNAEERQEERKTEIPEEKKDELQTFEVMGDAVFTNRLHSYLKVSFKFYFEKKTNILNTIYCIAILNVTIDR